MEFSFHYILPFFALLQYVSCGLPIVIWHGLGDVCCNPLSIGGLKRFMEQQIPNAYIISLRIGDNIEQDLENGFLKNANDQVEYVCNLLRNDTKLAGGYHALGFSQGGQFLRAVAQRCPDPPMVNLVTMGAQHQGVYGLPRCLGDNVKLCDYVRLLLNHGVYLKWIQKFVTPAEYWHDPLDEESYKESSVFLADINNEKNINEAYKTNLQQLENFVMVRFNNDTVVQPIASEWFGFYHENNVSSTYTLRESKLYLEDRLGLKAMDELGKLHFYDVDGEHLQFSRKWFNETIIANYFL